MVMGTASFSLLTSFVCFTTAALGYRFHLQPIANKRLIFLTTSSIALLLQAWALHRWIDTPLGQNLSLSHLLSLTCWLASLIILFTSLFKPLESLLIFTLPVSALSLLVSTWFPGHTIFQTALHPSGLVHILLSLVTFGLIGVAALQAFLLYCQNKALKHSANPPFTRLLPPLETMESFLFQIIAFGFTFLSASLLSAFVFLSELQLHQYVQKTILSLLAWGLFGGLLYTHYQSGFRGTRACQWTLVGIALLMAAYLLQRFLPSPLWN